MSLLLRSFFAGLLFVVPVAATVYALYIAFLALDSVIDTEEWLGVRVPGLGAAVTIVLVTVIGFLATNFLTGWILRIFDRLFTRMPLAKLIYKAIKDLLEAFVGEKRRFDKPVLVTLGGGTDAEVLGFLTREDLAWLDRKDSVAVYFPQSYNFAGQVLVFPRARVRPVGAEASSVMQFIVSGGVSGVQ